MINDKIFELGLLDIKWKKEEVYYPGEEYANLKCTFNNGKTYRLVVLANDRPREYDLIADFLDSQIIYE